LDADDFVVGRKNVAAQKAGVVMLVSMLLMRVVRFGFAIRRKLANG
jgi:hypothetical protein